MEKSYVSAALELDNRDVLHCSIDGLKQTSSIKERFECCRLDVFFLKLAFLAQLLL